MGPNANEIEANEMDPNEYKLEPTNSSIEQMPDISYDRDEDLSYRE
jgi:hypothetical protein